MSNEAAMVVFVLALALQICVSGMGPIWAGLVIPALYGSLIIRPSAPGPSAWTRYWCRAACLSWRCWWCGLGYSTGKAAAIPGPDTDQPRWKTWNKEQEPPEGCTSGGFSSV